MNILGIITSATSFVCQDLKGGQTQLLNLHRIKQTNCNAAKSQRNIAPDSISDTKNWLDWHGVLDNIHDSEKNWEVDKQYNIEPDNGITDSQNSLQRNVSGTQNIAGMVRPTRSATNKAEQLFITVCTMQMWRIKLTKTQ